MTIYINVTYIFSNMDYAAALRNLGLEKIRSGHYEVRLGISNDEVQVDKTGTNLTEQGTIDELIEIGQGQARHGFSIDFIPDHELFLVKHEIAPKIHPKPEHATWKYLEPAGRRGDIYLGTFTDGGIPVGRLPLKQQKAIYQERK